MRTFYVFNEIYNSKDDDLINNFRLFEKITIPFNKRIFNNFIMLKHRDDIYYDKKENKHFINSDNEMTKLTVNTTHLKIKTNKNVNSFIKDIIDSKENVFVIDFKNKDYFWLNQINYEPLV